MHGGEGAVSDAGKDRRELDGRERDPRLVSVEKKTLATSFSVDAYSLASQRRAIAYGRARGRS